MRHGYKTKQLGVYYEKNANGKWKALWFCSSSGTVIKEMELGNDSQP